MGNKNSGRRKTKLTGKPIPSRIDLPDGTIKLFGVVQAAEYLGCSPQSISMAVRGMPGRGTKLLGRIKAEFPQLLKKQKIKV